MFFLPWPVSWAPWHVFLLYRYQALQKHLAHQGLEAVEGVPDQVHGQVGQDQVYEGHQIIDILMTIS